ncbi:fibrinogen-like protein A isoform X2 [Physella acuta]|uniref:fibrinogen-like protein A isoform X2 n=1 Tax=Physella acuta TaxID=109671 RepID=UPI0027DB8424|nr:fibrinogen-like protein A isoform X2 [Physella acuta]
MDFIRLLCAIVLLFFQPCLCARAENDKNISKPKLKSLDLLLDPTTNMDSSNVTPTHFSRRVKGGVNFSRGWVDYKIGFGSFDGDFWIGNDWISYLTHNGYSELRCHFKYKGKSMYKVYRDFKVGTEADLYRLHFNNKTDDPQDLFTYNNGMAFSTFDRDNDISKRHCAERCVGGWWYKSCTYIKVTGDWTRINDCNGIRWSSMNGNIEHLEYAEMQLHQVNLK